MSTRTIRTNIGGTLTTQLGQPSQKLPSTFTVGKVFGVIMDENTPSFEVFEKYGKWAGLGTIFYLDYPVSKDVSNIKVTDCKSAKPFFPNQKNFPLVEELVVLFNLPSINTQDNLLSTETYYISVINLWNNVQHNSQPANNLYLGNTFTESDNIRTLLPFEGDHIIEGRTGNSLRFSSTTKFNNRENFWSITGNNGDPITLLTNGHNTSADNQKPYVEDINRDASGVYLTSTQKVPLKVRPFQVNPVFNPVKADLYFSSQSIIFGDRVVINSNKDEILLYGQEGIGLSTNNTIYLNSSKEILVNSPKIFLGMNNKELPTEPLLYGNQTTELLSKLIKELQNLATALSSAVSTPTGTPIIQLSQAGTELYTGLQSLMIKTNNLQKLISTKSYTA